MKLKVGLIGLGDQWETRHRPALLALSDRFEVKAICCEIAKKGERVASEFGAVALDGFRAMINRDDIEAVLALAPDWVGPLPILAACEAGKAVYSSVALDIAPEQVGRIRGRVQESGVAFMAELPRRYAAATLRMKELIATRLGQPTQMFCHERMTTEQQTSHLRRGEYCPLTWRSLMELADWCCYLIGREPSSVVSTLHHPTVHGQKSYYQSVNLQYDATPKFDLSANAQMSVGYYIPERWNEALSFRRPASIQICCENGVAFIDLPSTLVWFDDAGQHAESLEADRPVGEQMLLHFHRSVTSLVRNYTDLADAYRALKIVTGANDSASGGRRVSLDFD
ncbi:MAG: Gfo/Idh/MocA family oxidoreductase [Pirellulaceae bacterium]|nr:Gfo/Idh/MocA family oxidoreductase [Pirellulaceae bacterium]